MNEGREGKNVLYSIRDHKFYGLSFAQKSGMSERWTCQIRRPDRPRSFLQHREQMELNKESIADAKRVGRAADSNAVKIARYFLLLP